MENSALDQSVPIVINIIIMLHYITFSLLLVCKHIVLEFYRNIQKWTSELQTTLYTFGRVPIRVML